MSVNELTSLLADYEVTNISPMVKETYDIHAEIVGKYRIYATFKLPENLFREFMDHYHSVKDEIDPQYGYTELVNEFKNKVASNLSGELLGFDIYG